MTGVTATVTNLDLTAQTSVDYMAVGFVAQNDLSGDVMATIESSMIVAGAGGVSLTAIDQTNATAISPEFELLLGDPALALPISIDMAIASNVLDRNVEAQSKILWLQLPQAM